MPWSDAPGHVPLSNQILAALPPQEYQRLADSCEPVPLLKDAILYGPGQPIPYVFFPTSGLISFLMVLRNGTAIEVGMVGREGMAGLPIVLGTETSSARCLVQIPGEALRVASEILRTHLERNSLLQRLLLRFAHAFLARVTQLVACNSQHTVAQALLLLVAVDPRPGASGSIPDDARVPCQHAGRPAGQCDRSGRVPATTRAHPLRSWENDHPRPGQAGGCRLRVLLHHPSGIRPFALSP